MFDDLIPKKEQPASGGLFDDLIPAKPANKEKYGPEPADRGWLGYLNDVARAAANGVTFGFADEVAGAMGSLAGNRSYADIRDQERRGIEAFRETNPVAAYGAEMLGGVAVPGGAAKAALQGGKAAGAIKTGAGIGAASGALYGAGEAKDAESIPGAMATGAAAGLAGGALVPGAAALAPKAARAIAPALGNPIYGAGYGLATGDPTALLGQIAFRGITKMIASGGDDMAKAVKTITDSKIRTSGDELTNAIGRAYQGAAKLENEYERQAVMSYLAGLSGSLMGANSGRAAVNITEE